MKFIDITGEKFGKLTVVKKTDKRTKKGDYYWLCSCACGGTKETISWRLRKKLQPTRSCGCLHKEAMKKRRLSDKELELRSIENKKRYYKKNRDRLLQASKDRYKKNKVAKKEYDKKYRENNRDKKRKASNDFAKRHPKRVLANTINRRLGKKRRTPVWRNKMKIREIYEMCPSEFHVDHIVPLHGKSVCGLHVHNNLQYLTAEENMKKSNHFSFLHAGIR